MHQKYDITLKDILKDIPVKFLKILTGYESGKFLDVQFPDVQIRLPDLIIEVPDANIVQIEIQSTLPPNMLGRMYLYSGFIFNQTRIMPRQVLLYVGDNPCKIDNIVRSGINVYSFEVVDIRDINCLELLESDKPEDIILAILCKTENVDKTIKTILEKLSILPPKEREDYIRKLLYLSDLRKLYNKVNMEVKKMPITIDLQESDIFKEGLLEGQRKGLLEGVQKGKREGLLEGIELSLEIKYGSKGLELMDKVRLIKTVDKLEAFKELIKRSGTVDELAAFMENTV